MAFGGNVVLPRANVTTLQLAGITPGTGYDKIDVAGQLSFDGTLQMVARSLVPQLGQTFHLFNWGSEVWRICRNLSVAGTGRRTVLERVAAL